MKTVNKIVMLVVLMMSALVANAADNATKILDKTAAAYKSSGGVNIGFQMDIDGQVTTGKIKLSGNKFCCSTSGNVAWFDGKTMWHYVHDNEEVNVTNPSEKDLARMNPYSFLSMYKKGYTNTVKKTTDKEYQIEMKGNKGSGYRSIEVHLNKSSYQPTYIKMVNSKHTVIITINSYLKNQKFSATDFTFNKKEYPGAEVVDLR